MTYKYWIFKSIKYNLEKILSANGYTFDVGLVDLSQIDIKTIAPTPAIVVVQRALRREYQPARVTHFKLAYSMIPVVRLTDLEGAEGTMEVLNEFEADVNKCHHSDLFLRTAFSENPEVPVALRDFHLMDQKVGDTMYWHTRERAHCLIEIEAEYTIVGQEEI